MTGHHSSRPVKASPSPSAIPERAGTDRVRNPLGVALIVLAQSMQSLTFGGIALFLPLIRRDIGISFTQAGAIAASASIVYALMQMPSGYLADRFPAKRVFALGLLGTNVLAFSLALQHQYWSVLLNQAVTGFFRSLLFAPGLLLLTAQFPRGRRATAMGLYVAGGFTSNIFLNTTGPWLVGLTGWRHLFMFFAVAGVLMVAVFWRFGPAGPRGSPNAPLPLREMLGFLRDRAMLLVGAVQYVRLAMAQGMTFWLPTLIVVEKGYPLTVAGLLVALGAALTAPSNFLGGYLSDRLRNPYLVVAGSLSVLALNNLLLARAGSLALLVAAVAINGIFVQLYFGPLFAIPLELSATRSAGLATGFGNFFANLGGFSVVYLLGALKDYSGSFNAGLYVLSTLCLLGLVCTVLLSRIGRRSPPPQPSPSPPHEIRTPGHPRRSQEGGAPRFRGDPGSGGEGALNS